MRWMRTMALAGVVGVAALAVGAGCAKKGPQPMAVTPPASEDQLTAVREAYQKQDPGARVGRVIAVMPEDRLAAVGDLAKEDVKVGDVVTFVDAQQHVLTSGAVVRVVDDAAHVKYAQPSADRRAPVVGDLAVKVSSTAPNPAP